MCSITGAIRFDGGRVDPADLVRMASLQAHRGPDGAGWALLDEGRVGLAHTRLSIIDLAGGQQPLYNEDRSVAVSFNGEIYGYESLRRDLSRRGHRLSTTSDTEVLVHLWEDYGELMMDRIDGEFAFVLWDQRRGQLVAARDRSGIKPLYWHEGRGELLIASEAKALLSLDRVPRALNPESLKALALGLYPSGSSPYQGLQTLEPGHLLLADRGGRVRKARYWSLHWQPDVLLTADSAAEMLDDALAAAVKDRLVADVPVGVYLSSGVDSAYVASLMAGSGASPRAFHLMHGDDDVEAGPARALADHLGFAFEPIVVGLGDLAEALESTLWHTELPLWNLHSVAKALLSREAARRGAKVCLTGEGADETFGGYPYFQWEALHQAREERHLSEDEFRLHTERFTAAHQDSEGILWGRWPRWRTAPSTGRLSYHLTRAWENQRTLRSAFRSGFGGAYDESQWTPNVPEAYNLTRTLAREVLHHYVIPTLGDRVELGHGVECRTPFLDRRVLEIGATLPEHLLFDALTGRDKIALRLAARRRVPASILDAPKRPFLSPRWKDLWSHPQGRELVERHLSPAAIRDHGIYDADYLSALVTYWKQSAEPTPQLDLLMGSALSVHLLEDLLLKAPPVRPEIHVENRSPALV